MAHVENYPIDDEAGKIAVVHPRNVGGEMILSGEEINWTVAGFALVVFCAFLGARWLLRQVLQRVPRRLFGEKRKGWSGIVNVVLGVLYVSVVGPRLWETNMSTALAVVIFILLLIERPTPLTMVRWLALTKEDKETVEAVADFVRLIRPDLVVQGKGGYDQQLDMTAVSIWADNITAELLDVKKATRFAVYSDMELTEHVINVLVLPKGATFPFFWVRKQEEAVMTNICFERLANHTNERLKLTLLSLRKQRRSHVTLGLPGIGKSGENNLCLLELLLNMGSVESEPDARDAALLATAINPAYEHNTYMWPQLVLLRLDETIVRIQYSRLTGEISVQGEHVQNLESVMAVVNRTHSNNNRSVAIIEFLEEEHFQRFGSRMACVFSQSSRKFRMKEMQKKGALVEHIAVPLAKEEVSVVGQVCEMNGTKFNLSRHEVEKRAKEFGGVLRYLLGSTELLDDARDQRITVKTSTIVGDLTRYNVPGSFRHFVTPYPLYGTKNFDPRRRNVFAFLSPLLRDAFKNAKPPTNMLTQLYVSCSAENEYLVGELLGTKARLAVPKCKIYCNTRHQVKTKHVQNVQVPGLFLMEGRPHGLSFSSLFPAAMMTDEYVYVPCSEQHPLFDVIVCSSEHRKVFLVQTSVRNPVDHAFKIAQLQEIKQDLAIDYGTNLVFIYVTGSIGKKHGLKFEDDDEVKKPVVDHMQQLGLHAAYIMEYSAVKTGQREATQTDLAVVDGVATLFE